MSWVDPPTCPGADCPMCNGEACALCGAGTRTRFDEPPCEHDVIERHTEAIADELPLPPDLAPGGDADPDRPERWRDHEEDTRGPEPDDVVDSDETFALFAAYEANHGRDVWKPAMVSVDSPTGRGDGR